MKKVIRKNGRQYPVITSRGEDGFYIAQCPTLPGCFTQGKTLDEALKNIREAIILSLDESSSKLQTLASQDVSLHQVSV